MWGYAKGFGFEVGPCFGGEVLFWGFAKKLLFMLLFCSNSKILLSLLILRANPKILVFIILAFMPFCLGKGLVKLVGFGLKSLKISFWYKFCVVFA